MGLLGDILDMLEDEDHTNLGDLPHLPPSPIPRKRRAGMRVLERAIDKITRQNTFAQALSAADRGKKFKPVAAAPPRVVTPTMMISARPPTTTMTALAPPRTVMTVQAPIAPSVLAQLVTAGSTAAKPPTPMATAPAIRPRMTIAALHGCDDDGYAGLGLTPAEIQANLFPDPSAPPPSPPPPDPNAPDATGVAPSHSPKGMAWVSQDLFETVPDANVWHWRGQKMKMRFAQPVADMRAILDWPQYDEYGKVDPSWRSFDNKPSMGPDPFGWCPGCDPENKHGFTLDDLDWVSHGPRGRSIDMAAVRYLTDFLPVPTAFDKLNIRWRPIDTSFRGSGMATAQSSPFDDYRGEWQFSQQPADFWVANMSGGEPKWADPYRPIPIDLLNWYYLHKFVSGAQVSEVMKASIQQAFADDPGLATMIASGQVKPDEWSASANDFWAKVERQAGNLGYLGAAPTSDRPYYKALGGWANVENGADRAGRMLVTTYDPRDVAMIVASGGSLPAGIPGFSSIRPPEAPPEAPPSGLPPDMVPPPTDMIPPAPPSDMMPPPTDMIPTDVQPMGPSGGGNLPTEPSYDQPYPSDQMYQDQYYPQTYDPYGAYAAQYGDQNVYIEYDLGPRGDGYASGGGQLPDLTLYDLSLEQESPWQDFEPVSDPYREQAVNIFDNQQADDAFQQIYVDNGSGDFYVDEGTIVDTDVDFNTPSDRDRDRRGGF